VSTSDGSDVTFAPRDAPRQGRPDLAIGPLRLWPPVVLAPMAGVTNAAFRRLCREHGAGLYVSEMVNARGVAEGGAKSCELAHFDEDESPRSIQLYGTDPAAIAIAVARLVEERGVDHVDLNFGCPVRKVTRHGGGAAVPCRPRLLGAIVAAAVGASGPVPVTVKMRLGIDDERMTYLDAGRVAEAEGAAAVALHARTATQLYSGAADWTAIAALKTHLGVPVLGNGDVWVADDALAMVARTGADGVVVGRGCLGRPWLFRDLVDAFGGRAPRPAPRLGAVAATIARHAELLAERQDETTAVRALRKHIAWYLTGYAVGGEARRRLMSARDLVDLRVALGDLDPSLEVPPWMDGAPRGTRAGPQTVHLPEGWAGGDATPPPREAEALVSGG
jgi:nifR3 family TIM-barrel protein